MVPSARGSSRSRRNWGRGMLPTTPAAKRGQVRVVVIGLLAPFFLGDLVVLSGVDLVVLAVGVHLADVDAVLEHLLEEVDEVGHAHGGSALEGPIAAACDDAMVVLA